MQRRHELKESEWKRIENFLPGRPGTVGKPAEDNLRFVNGVIWIARTGAPWRDLPERYGKWSSVWKRFRRWALTGIWDKVFKELAIDADLEEMLLDSTIVRAHQQAAGAKKKEMEQRKTKD
jgi:transposase